MLGSRLLWVNHLRSGLLRGLLGLSLVLFLFPVNADAGFSHLCKRAFSNVISQRDAALRVRQLVADRLDEIKRRPYGDIWLSYIDQQVRNGLYEVQISGQLKETLERMAEDIARFRDMTKQTVNVHRMLELVNHKDLLRYIETQLALIDRAGYVGRAQLVQLMRLFSYAASYHISLYTKEFLGNNYSARVPALDIIIRTTVTEEFLDRKYGKTALFVPIYEPWGFDPFLEVEPTGIIPIGITTNVEHMAGKILNPVMFTKRDFGHASMSLSYRSARPGPVDRRLAYFMNDGLAFHSDLFARLKQAGSKRKQALIKAVGFFMIHEKTTEYGGIRDFNRAELRKSAKKIIDSKSSYLPSAYDFTSLITRLGIRSDLGAAFKKAPTEKEVLEALRWYVD